MKERKLRIRKSTKVEVDLSPPSKAKKMDIKISEKHATKSRAEALYQNLLSQMTLPAQYTHSENLREKRLVVLSDEDSFVGATAEVVFASQENDDKSKKHVALKSTYIAHPTLLTDTCYRELLIHHTLSDLKHNNRCANYVELIDWFKSKGWPAEDDENSNSRLINHTQKTIHEDPHSDLVFRVEPCVAGCGQTGLRKRRQDNTSILKRRRLMGNRRYYSIEHQDDETTEPTVPPEDVLGTTEELVLPEDHITSLVYYPMNNSDDLNDVISSQQSIIISDTLDDDSSQNSALEVNDEEEESSSQSSSRSESRRNFKHVRKMKQQYMNLVLERADMTLIEHLRAVEYKVDLIQYKCILFQILFSLHIGQRDYEFVHNDLHLGNIMMKHLSTPSYITHLAFTFEEKCWLCPVSHFPYMIKLADFGLSRLKLPHNGEIIYNLKYPYHSSFLPFKDKVKVSQSLASRVKIAWGDCDEEQKAYYRDLRKKLSREDLYTPSDLLCHPFFQSMMYDPESIDIDWEKHMAYTYGDVKVFDFINTRQKNRKLANSMEKVKNFAQKSEEVIDPHQAELIVFTDVSGKRVQPKRRVKRKEENQSPSFAAPTLMTA